VRVTDADAVPPRRRVSCPGCRVLCEYSVANPYRPFCSQRCKLGDLGAWAEERYRVEAPPPREDDEPLPG
jgi:uncharacterized protein